MATVAMKKIKQKSIFSNVLMKVLEVILCNMCCTVMLIRYLVLMRSWYLLSSSRNSLNAELLSRLELTTSPCWTEKKLHSVQLILTESLLSYW